MRRMKSQGCCLVARSTVYRASACYPCCSTSSSGIGAKTPMLGLTLGLELGSAEVRLAIDRLSAVPTLSALRARKSSTKERRCGGSVKLLGPLDPASNAR